MVESPAASVGVNGPLSRCDNAHIRGLGYWMYIYILLPGAHTPNQKYSVIRLLYSNIYMQQSVSHVLISLSTIMRTA
jgi:hypothetical protein